MKKVTAIVLALLMVLSLAACGSAASESKTLVMATSADYPPYEFIVLNDKNEQQYVGIDVSVSEAIAADMGKELQIVNMDFDSLMAGLQKGDADIVLAAIEVTEERLEAADFSDPYYTDLPPMILVKADKAGEPFRENDLVVKETYVDEGVTLKRFRARAQGRAARINKRTSHITVVVANKEGNR